jgi:hypothetical protein
MKTFSEEWKIRKLVNCIYPKQKILTEVSQAEGKWNEVEVQEACSLQRVTPVWTNMQDSGAGMEFGGRAHT